MTTAHKKVVLYATLGLLLSILRDLESAELGLGHEQTAALLRDERLRETRAFLARVAPSLLDRVDAFFAETDSRDGATDVAIEAFEQTRG